jgi:hypothetical protein
VSLQFPALLAAGTFFLVRCLPHRDAIRNPLSSYLLLLPVFAAPVSLGFAGIHGWAMKRSDELGATPQLCGGLKLLINDNLRQRLFWRELWILLVAHTCLTS